VALITTAIYLALGGAAAPPPRSLSPKAVIEAKFAAVNRHAVADIVELYAPDARLTSSGFCTPRQGRADVQRTYQDLIDAVPDLAAQVTVHVVEGNRVAVSFTARGHLQGKSFAVRIANFFTVRDGLIESDDGVYDTGGRPCVALASVSPTPATSFTTVGETKEPERVMSSKEKNAEVMLKVFSAIEQRDQPLDPQRALDLFQPDVEFSWPLSLPYGGISHGLRPEGPTWRGTWDALQPTEAERRLDPRVVAASEEEVVVLWRQRGISPAGDRIDTPVLGLYRLREGKLARAQMFYFDTPAVLGFLARVKGQ